MDRFEIRSKTHTQVIGGTVHAYDTHYVVEVNDPHRIAYSTTSFQRANYIATALEMNEVIPVWSQGTWDAA